MTKNIFVIRPKGLNVGNDAIFLGLMELMRRHFDEMPNIISIPATSKYDSVANAGLTAKTIHEINQFGHGVIIGGGNLFENGELDMNIDALPKLSPPLMLFSLSRGRTYDRFDSLMDRTDVMPDEKLMKLSNQCSILLARDLATANHLTKLGLSNHVLGACPTLFLDSLIPRLPRIPEHQEDRTLISVRTPDLMNISLRRRARVPGAVRGIHDALKNRGFENISLLCHDSRDIPFAASFEDIPYFYHSDPYEYLSLIRSAKILVSYRIHGSLPALALGTPFVNISYDERASSLMETIGLKQWDVNMISSPDLVDEVIDRVERMHELPSILNSIQRKLSEFNDAQDSAMASFFKMADQYDLVGQEPR